MPSVSVCLICGNEESVILNLLKTCLPFMAQLCLVRAIGDQIPDKTTSVASEFCFRNGISFVCEEYRNNVPMPHVDNFAAARNQAFALADKPWSIWLDCDDYLTPENAAKIEEAAQTCTADAVMCKYRIEDKGGVIYRERLIRTGKGKWVGAIHETCQVDGVTVERPDIEVFHSSPGAKSPKSAERNLRILEASGLRDARHLFYLHSELFRAGRREEARLVGRDALAALGPDKPEERYFVLLTMAELEPENEQRHLLEALATQPHRREALADLCQSSLSRKDASAARSWFRMMDALPMPDPIPWTHRGMWYGWARDFLRVRVLEASGNLEQAHNEHSMNMANPEYRAGVEAFT